MIRTGLLATLALCLQVGCAPHPPPPAAEQPDAALATFAVSSIPDDATTTRIDFGGQVQLLGYAVAPGSVAGPGKTIEVDLYWRRVGPVSAKWRLFTHLLDIRGRHRKSYDDAGSFRKTGSHPARWEFGKIYKDTVSVQVPGDIRGDEIAIGVGLYHRVPATWVGDGGSDQQADEIRMHVMGGLSNRKNVGIVTYVSTGLPAVPQLLPKKAQAQKPEKNSQVAK